jgi:hypothetical protein
MSLPHWAPLILREGHCVNLTCKPGCSNTLCSYLIYSEAFDALPDSAKEPIYRQLHEILTGKNTGEDYAHLTPEDRQAILEILRETKDDLPSYWKSAE